MATFADLQAEILFRLNRAGDPTIAQAATDFSLDRIYALSNELFFASERQDTSLILKPAQHSYALPAGVLEILFVRVNLGGTYIPIRKVAYEDILMWDVQATSPVVSVPATYAILGRTIRFFPRPDLVYQVELTIEGQPLPPVNSTDSNFWTNEAFTLIVEAACEDISRSLLNDDARAQRHGQLVARELKMLRMQTHVLLGPIQVRPRP